MSEPITFMGCKVLEGCPAFLREFGDGPVFLPHGARVLCVIDKSGLHDHRIVFAPEKP